MGPFPAGFWLAVAVGCAGSAGDSSRSSETGAPSTSVTVTRPVPPCVGSEPVRFPDGAPSGLETCDDGRVHRVAVVPVLPPGDAYACSGSEPYVTCSSDADCDGGLCRDIAYYRDSCGCVPTCTTDADCAPGAACLGAGAGLSKYDFGTCTWGNDCTTDADCASGLCGFSAVVSECGVSVSLTCRTTSDACAIDADCPSGETCTLPSYSADGGWGCMGPADCDVR